MTNYLFLQDCQILQDKKWRGWAFANFSKTLQSTDKKSHLIFTMRWTIEHPKNKKICFNPWKKSVNEKKKLNNSKTDIWVLFVKFIIINWNLNKLGKNFHFFITTWKNKNGFLIVHCWTLMKQQTNLTISYCIMIIVFFEHSTTL